MFNKKDLQIRRGDIYYADLNPMRGSEQGGIRPVVVIQNNCGNFHSPTIIVVSTTTKLDKPSLPTHILIRKSNYDGLEKDSIVMMEQIRTIDRTRLVGYIGHLNGNTIQSMDRALAVSVGLSQVR